MTELINIPIDVADTRPAMWMGMPLEMLAVYVVVAGEIVTIFGILYVPFLAIAWWALAQLVRKDFNAPRVFYLWMTGAALDFDASDWGGTSVPPIPAKNDEYRGMEHV
ncbi:MAG: virB3 [Rhodoferax sp.]|nr:virB3 [Rhodoferax sp.]